MSEASWDMPCETCPTGHTMAHRWWDGKRACVCGQRHVTCWLCSQLADLTGTHDEALLHICPATDEFQVAAAVAR